MIAVLISQKYSLKEACKKYTALTAERLQQVDKSWAIFQQLESGVFLAGVF